MAVGPKYRKYGTWVRLLELMEVRPEQRIKLSMMIAARLGITVYNLPGPSELTALRTVKRQLRVRFFICTCRGISGRRIFGVGAFRRLRGLFEFAISYGGMRGLWRTALHSARALLTGVIAVAVHDGGDRRGPRRGIGV